MPKETGGIFRREPNVALVPSEPVKDPTFPVLLVTRSCQSMSPITVNKFVKKLRKHQNIWKSAAKRLRFSDLSDR